MRNLASAVLAATLAAAALPAQTAGSNERTRIEITLERKEGANWRAVEPALVLASGDLVRFRFKSNFDGYLYVTNLGTSGEYTLLFPREETGRRNLVSSGKDYLVPATSAHFKISGPAGYESVYWLVSPVSLGERPDLTPAKPSGYKPPVLMPRCDPTLLRARSLCLDPQAGPRLVEDNAALPDELGKIRMTTRELNILQSNTQTVLSTPPGRLAAPVLYEFRIAHK